MSKIFISYRYTGEDPKKLNLILNKLEKVLNKNGHEVFHSMKLEKYFIENNFSNKEIYKKCLEIQEESDICLALVKSPENSRGMEKEFIKSIEIEQRYILAIKKYLDFPEYRASAEKVIEYNNFKDLCDLLSNYTF
jgi:hypothetical protein